MKAVALVVLLTGLFIASSSMAQTTVPSDDGPKVAPNLAPSYIEIGRKLEMQLDLVKQDVSELSLTPDVRRQADQLIDGQEPELKFLVGEMQAGRMPTNTRVMAVPGNLHASRKQLLDLIGPDQTKLLQEKMDSIRGESRARLGQLRLMVDDLKLDGPATDRCAAIFTQTASQVEKLPEVQVQGDEAQADRDRMNLLFADAHDQLAKVLTAAQLEQMGPQFAQLAAARPATQPSSKG